MRYGARILTALLATTAVAAVGCSDSSRPLATAPVRAADSPENAALLGGVLGTLTGTVTSLLVSPVHRTTPLAEDVTWTFTATRSGGSTSNSAVGLTVKVPSGALDRTQTITITALKGSAIAYRFEPHLKFDRKVVLTQSLRGTTAEGLLDLNVFKGAHFDGDEPEYNADGTVTVTEVVSATLNLLSKTVSFGVDHFSGWIVASGYDNGY